MGEEKQLWTAHQLAAALNVSVDTEGSVIREQQGEYASDRERRDDHLKHQREKRLTYADYVNLPEVPGYRFEVLEGMLVKEPSPNVMHQRVSRRLQRILEDYFWHMDEHGEVFNAPLDVTFADTTVVQPDLFYVAGEQQDIVKDVRVDGAPTLVVEVLSPANSRKDRMQKLRIYQKGNVAHYWLVDPENKTLECFSLQNGVYALVASGMDDDVVQHPEFDELMIVLTKLWLT